MHEHEEYDDETLTRARIAETVFQATGMPLSQCAALVDSVFERMILALEEGEEVKVPGFGTFSVREKNERIGRNPKTGVEVPIAPRKVLRFRASAMLKKRINEAMSEDA